MTSNPIKVNGNPYTYIVYVVLILRSTKFQSASLRGQSFSNYRLYKDKYTKRPQSNIQHYKVKGTQYMFC